MFTFATAPSAMHPSAGPLDTVWVVRGTAGGPPPSTRVPYARLTIDLGLTLATLLLWLNPR